MTLWLMGRHLKPQDAPLEWEFMGIFDTKAAAVASCTLYYDFICPVQLNVRLPDETVLMPEIEYPLSPDFHPTE